MSGGSKRKLSTDDTLTTRQADAQFLLTNLFTTAVPTPAGSIEEPELTVADLRGFVTQLIDPRQSKDTLLAPDDFKVALLATLLKKVTTGLLQPGKFPGGRAEHLTFIRTGSGHKTARALFRVLSPTLDEPGRERLLGLLRTAFGTPERQSASLDADEFELVLEAGRKRLTPPPAPGSKPGGASGKGKAAVEQLPARIEALQAANAALSAENALLVAKQGSCPQHTVQRQYHGSDDAMVVFVDADQGCRFAASYGADQTVVTIRMKRQEGFQEIGSMRTMQDFSINIREALKGTGDLSEGEPYLGLLKDGQTFKRIYDTTSRRHRLEFALMDKQLNSDFGDFV